MRPLKHSWIDNLKPLNKTLEAVVKGLGLVAVLVAQVVAIFRMLPR